MVRKDSSQSGNESVVPAIAPKMNGIEGMDSDSKLSLTSGACSRAWVNEHQRYLYEAPLLIHESKMSWRWDRLDRKSCQQSRCVQDCFSATDFSIKRLACPSVSQIGRLMGRNEEYLLRHEQSQELFRIIFLSINGR